MTWWEWALLVVWGPGTLLAAVVVVALLMNLVADRLRPAPAAPTGGDETPPQPRNSVESTDVAGRSDSDDQVTSPVRDRA